MNSREKGLDCKCCVTMDSAKGSCTIKNPDDPKAPPKMFTFDGAYYTDSTTEAIYNDIAYPLVEVGKNTRSVQASACVDRGIGRGVGGEYLPFLNRYDGRRKRFLETYSEWG